MNKLETAKQLAQQTTEQKPFMEPFQPKTNKGTQQASAETEKEIMNFIQAVKANLNLTASNQQALKKQEQKSDHMEQILMKQNSTLKMIVIIQVITIIALFIRFLIFK